MKTKILIIKKQVLISILLCIVAISVFCVTYFSVKVTNLHKPTYTIVIDAGHGGIDGGCVGESGVNESTLTLKYAKTLEQYFSEFGFKVVMTRTNEGGLYGAFSRNKKKDDMQKRKQIIENSSADVVVSLHMNSYPSQSSRGAQVFYNKDSENSKSLAKSIQNQFLKSLVKPRKSCLPGDYYMVSCTKVPSVIVECGFVSNAEEEKLLLSDEYREKVCYSILCGVVLYFD